MSVSASESRKNQTWVIAVWCGLKALFVQAITRLEGCSTKLGAGTFFKKGNRHNSFRASTLLPFNAVLTPTILIVTFMSILFVCFTLSPALAAPAMQKYTQKQWFIMLQDQGINLKNWGGMNDESFSFIKLKKPRDKQAWLKEIRARYPNTATQQGGNAHTMTVYILPSGVAQKHIKAVATYDQKKSNDPFAKFSPKKLRLVKHIMQLPEVKMLQKFTNVERKSGIYYERFVNPPQDVKAYYFTVEYMPQFKAMLPIIEKSSPHQQGMEGFARAGSVLSYIQANADRKWSQYKGSDGARYFKANEDDAPLFVVSQKIKGVTTIAMRTTMPNGTPFSYVIRKKGRTFTSTTKLHSGANSITLLDFAKLGDKP